MITYSDFSTEAGRVTIEEAKGKIKLFAYNLERGKRLHVGSKIGDVYETVKPIFRQRQTFNLTEPEFSAVLETGARFIRIIPPDKSGSYSIEVERFARFAQKYTHPRYGAQLACPLKYFACTSQVSPRNARADSPVIEQAAPLVRDRQMSLFG